MFQRVYRKLVWPRFLPRIVRSQATFSVLQGSLHFANHDGIEASSTRRSTFGTPAFLKYF